MDCHNRGSTVGHFLERWGKDSHSWCGSQRENWVKSFLSLWKVWWKWVKSRRARCGGVCCLSLEHFCGGQFFLVLAGENYYYFAKIPVQLNFKFFPDLLWLGCLDVPTKIKFPAPGIEPGPAGWEPAILTTRPCWTVTKIGKLRQVIVVASTKLSYFETISCLLFVF